MDKEINKINKIIEIYFTYLIYSQLNITKKIILLFFPFSII